MLARDTLGQLPAEGLLDLDKLSWVNDIQYLLHFSQEHHLTETPLSVREKGAGGGGGLKWNHCGSVTL